MRPLIITVFMGNVEATDTAILDMLKQDGEPTVLAVQQGAEELLLLGRQETPRLILWRHNPPLPSLAATWNRALDFAWEIGCDEAMVVNNDVRLHKETYLALHEGRRLTNAWFISGVGVTAEQFQDEPDTWGPEHSLADRGGPDFSCFLISRECHAKYRFDENLIPAYMEDMDYHRRLMLGGDGDRIFSVNVPYLHIDRGSGTLKAMTPEKRAAHEKRISEGSRAYYARKWGGGANEETYREPFSGHAQEGVKTSEMFGVVRAGWNASKS